jgi:hypothetical protein
MKQEPGFKTRETRESVQEVVAPASGRHVRKTNSSEPARGRRYTLLMETTFRTVTEKGLLFFVVFLLVCVGLLWFGCGTRTDVNQTAHPVYVDAFMSKRLESEILDYRKRKDDMFKTSADSPLPPEIKMVFQGLEYYPIDWLYRFEGPVTRYPDPPKFTMISTDGEKRQAIKFGYIRLEINGKEYPLQVYRLLDSEEKDMLFVPFVDANTGKETYEAGRYLDLEERPNGLYVVDFNRAYNPSCAYGGNYSCPVTPQENRIPVPILAGEKILPLTPKLGTNVH